MPPPAARAAAGIKRRREVTTLDEDEWTARIEAIIQRDYYPDLPKLQNKLEWLQVGKSGFLMPTVTVTYSADLTPDTCSYVAHKICTTHCKTSSCTPAYLVTCIVAMQAVRSGDAMQIQQAQLNIAQRRAGIRTPVGATPAAFGTPGASLLRTPGLGGTPAFGTPVMTPGLHVTAGTFFFFVYISRAQSSMQDEACSTFLYVCATLQCTVQCCQSPLESQVKLSK